MDKHGKNADEVRDNIAESDPNVTIDGSNAPGEEYGKPVVIETKAPGSRKVTVRNVFSVALTVFLFLVVCLFAYMAYQNRVNKRMEIAGFKILTVITGSMTPAINPGDLIVVVDADIKKLEVGDVITYIPDRYQNKVFVTHRIVNISEDRSEITTRGDANNVDDPPITPDHIEGKKILVIPFMGRVFEFLSTTAGLLVLAIVFVVYVVLEAVVKEYRKSEKDAEEKRLKKADDLKYKVKVKKK